MELKQILEELEKKESRWEKRAFIQLVLEQETDPKITEKLSIIKHTLDLEERTGSVGTIKIPEAPKLEETKVVEIEQMVEAHTPLNPDMQGAPIEKEYEPLQTQQEIAKQYQGNEQYEQEPSKKELINFVDQDLRGKVFNKGNDELISVDLDKKIKEDAYKKRVDHG